MAPKKIYKSTLVNLCRQLTPLQFDMGDPFHGQLTAVKTRYRITGSSVELNELTCFLKVYRSPGYEFSLDRRLKYFHKLLKQAFSPLLAKQF